MYHIRSQGIAIRRESATNALAKQPHLYVSILAGTGRSLLPGLAACPLIRKARPTAASRPVRGHRRSQDHDAQHLHHEITRRTRSHEVTLLMAEPSALEERAAVRSRGAVAGRRKGR